MINEDQIVKFTDDEGRDRLANPSLNAPHSYREAVLACLMSARRQMTQPTGVNQPIAPDASPQQKQWLADAYHDAQRRLTDLIERVASS